MKQTSNDDLISLLTTTQAGAVLGISRKRVTQLIHAGKLPAVRLGTDWFIRFADLALVKDRKPGRPRADASNPPPAAKSGPKLKKKAK